MYQLAKLSLIALTLGLMQGCSSLGVGESEYGCPGMPTGVQCMSVKDVYHNTSNGHSVTANAEMGLNNDQKGVTEGNQVNQSGNNIDFVTKRYIEENLPYNPIPIRTPSLTMRIYVDPYEDAAGDLLVPGLIYTDVEKRRWVIGEPYSAKQKSTLSINQNHIK